MMDARIEVLDEEISISFRLLSEAMAKRLAARKRLAYASANEVFETADEEFGVELLKAMHARDRQAFAAESVNVAVTMVLGVASSRAYRQLPGGGPAPQLTDQDLSDALKRLGDDLARRLREKGRKSFMGMAEIYRTAAEELKLELFEAVMEKKEEAIVSESIDVAVAMLFGVASLLARKRHEDSLGKN